MKAEQFDAQFNHGDNITSALDLTKSRRPGRQQRRVNVDFPVWMIDALDSEASRLGITRQSVIKMWIANRLDQHRKPAA